MLPSRTPFRSVLPSGRVSGSLPNAAKSQQPVRMGKISRQTLIEKGLPKIVRSWKGKTSSGMLQRVKRASKDVYHQLRYGRPELSKNKATALIGQMQEQLPKAEQDKSARSILKAIQGETRREQEQAQMMTELDADRAAQKQAYAQERQQHKQQLRQAMLRQVDAQKGSSGLAETATTSVAALTGNKQGTPQGVPQGTGKQVPVGTPPASSNVQASTTPLGFPESDVAPLAGTSVPASIPSATVGPLHLTTDVVVPPAPDGKTADQDDEELPDTTQIHEGGLPL